MAKWQHNDFGGVIYTAKEQFFPLEQITQVRYGDSKTIDFMVTPDIEVKTGVPSEDCATGGEAKCIELQTASVTADTKLDYAYQLPDCYDLKSMTETQVKSTLSAKGAEELRKSEIITIVNKIKASAKDTEGILFNNLSHAMINILNTLQMTGASNENIVFLVSQTAMNSLQSTYLLGNYSASQTPTYNGVVNFREDFVNGYGVKNVIVVPDLVLNGGQIPSNTSDMVHVLGYDYTKVFTNIFCRKDPSITPMPVSGYGYVDQLLMKELIGTNAIDDTRICFAKGDIQGFDIDHSETQHGVKKQK